MIIGAVNAAAFYAFLTAFGYLVMLSWRKQFGESERLLFSFPVGSGLFAIATAVMSTFLGISMSASSLSLLLLSLIVAVALLQLFTRNLSFPLPRFALQLSFPAILMALFIVALSLHALSLPIYKQDPYMYHLPVAQDIYEQGKLPDAISPSILRYEYAYPPLPYLLYAFSAFFYGSFAVFPAKLLPLLFGLLFLGIAYRTGRTFLDSRTALLGLLLFISAYSFSNIIAFSNTQVILACYVAAALHVLLRLIRQPSLPLYILFGLMSALGYWVNYTAIVLFGTVWLILTLYSLSRRTNAFLIAAAAFTIFLISPHLLHNLSAAGNPLYPLLPSILGWGGITPWYAQNILAATQPTPLVAFDWRFFLQLSYVLLPLTAAALLLRSKLEQKLLFAFGLSYLTAWSLLFSNTGMPNTYRYLVAPVLALSLAAAPAFSLFLQQRLTTKMKLTFLALLAPPAAHSAWQLLNRQSPAEHILLLSAFAAIAAYASTTIKLKHAQAAMLLILLLPSALSLAVQPITYREDLFSPVTYHDAGSMPRWMDENLPANATILYFLEHTYLVPRTIVPADDPSVQPIYTGISLDEAIRLLKSRGITHISSSDSRFGVYRIYNDSVVHNNMHEPYFTLLYNESAGGYQRTLYRIN